MITILRIGHRPQRDKRITTHVALVARAFGADGMLLAGDDPSIGTAVDGVAERFGGDFKVRNVRGYRKAINEWDGPVVHLTMYGEQMDDVVDGLRGKDIMVIVGAEKVPGDVYELSDHNIAVGNQPHSEVAALAVFLDRLFNGEELRKDFGGPMKVIPTARGKIVVEK